MTQRAHFVSPARMAHWPDVAAFVEAFCDRHGVARDDMLRLTLLAEELFTNAADHGSAGGIEVQARLELGLVPGALELLFEDTGRPFDPLSHVAELPPDLEAALDERSVGGLGLHIVATLAHGARYSREEGCNRLRLRLELGAGDAPHAAQTRPA